MNYLAIIDNIHDFFHGRGKGCPRPFKQKIVEAKMELEKILEEELKQKGINIKLSLDTQVDATTTTPEFESDYTEQILVLLGLEEGIRKGKLGGGPSPYTAFIEYLGLKGKTFFTTHDAAFKMRNFRFDSKKEATLGCTHCILKTPQNNFDSATSAASPTVSQKKTVIVYPVNGADNEWIFKSNILTRNMSGKMSFKYAEESRGTKLLGSLALWQKFEGKNATFRYEGTITIETEFKPIGARESGPGPKLLCEALIHGIIPNPKTVAEKIYNKIVKTTLLPDEQYNLILDLKRSGDWEQVLSAKWFK